MSGAGLVAAGIAVLIAGGAGAAAARRPLADRLFRVACLLGCALAVAGAARGLGDATPSSLAFAWGVPGGDLALRLDPLGAWFAIVVAVVGACAGFHAPSYLANADRARFARFMAAYMALLVSLLVLTLASNALLFLAAWELMTVSAYFLVTVRHEDAEVRAAGRLYIVANHTAAFCLLALVGLLVTAADSFDFDAIARKSARGETASFPFVLALVAFGTKASIIPLHIWLPHAHPAAPAPVSAVLSGVVVKAGIFGFLRFLPLLPPVPSWAGPAVLTLGAVSGVLGVLYALAQHDVKRLLAYHTVENVGIILLGIGVGMIGVRSGHPTVAALGFAGALLHVLNHALFKALLFLGAGSAVHATGTAEMDRLGGLARRMPWTAATFLVGCVCICALPPGNGFASEWAVYRGAFEEAAAGSGTDRVACVVAAVALALIGGLATACFAKAFSAVFLGAARTPAAAAAHEAPVTERLAMGALAAVCLGIGLLPHLAARAVWPVVRQAAGRIDLPSPVVSAMPQAWGPIAFAAAVLLAAVAFVWIVRGRSPQAEAARVPTWGCGYALPSPRMQYTSSSFAAPIVSVFRMLLMPRVRHERPMGIFPTPPRLHTASPDPAETFVYRPAFRGLARCADAVRSVQRIPVQAQAALVVATLAALLLWKVTR